MLAASAVMGETVPPCIAMLIVGSITQLSMAGAVHRGLDSGGGDGGLPDGAHLFACPPRGDAAHAAGARRVMLRAASLRYCRSSCR